MRGRWEGIRDKKEISIKELNSTESRINLRFTRPYLFYPSVIHFLLYRNVGTKADGLRNQSTFIEKSVDKK